jgi:hypothetical protein
MTQILWRAPAEQRKETRYAIGRNAILFHDGVGEPVIIKNMSCFGAMLLGRSFPPIAGNIEIVADGLDVSATVTWRGDDQRGVLLSHEVDPRAILLRPVTVNPPICMVLPVR